MKIQLKVYHQGKVNYPLGHLHLLKKKLDLNLNHDLNLNLDLNLDLNLNHLDHQDHLDHLDHQDHLIVNYN